MNSRVQVIIDFRILVCIILVFVGASNETPVETPVAADGITGTPGSIVVPQVGFLEDRPDVTVQKDALTSPNSDAGKGILVPIVSVVNPGDSTAKNANPLVALLPAAPATGGSSADPAKLPVVATLPIVPSYDAAQPAAPSEIRRSLDDLSSGTKIETNLRNNDDSSETMDVAEDIVFRPLFKIRQNPGSNDPAYTRGNLLRRKNASNNYRRYNVNGYYRLPYNSFRYNNNRDDYRNDRSSVEY